MDTVLFILVALVPAIPLLLFLPIGLSRGGKLAVLAVSLLLSLLAAAAQSVFPLWQLALLLLLLAAAFTYLLDRQLGHLLYAAASDEENDEDELLIFDRQEKEAEALPHENSLPEAGRHAEANVAPEPLEPLVETGEDETAADRIEEELAEWRIPSIDAEAADDAPSEGQDELPIYGKEADDEWLSAPELERWLEEADGEASPEANHPNEEERSDWRVALESDELLLEPGPQNADLPRADGQESLWAAEDDGLRLLDDGKSAEAFAQPLDAPLSFASWEEEEAAGSALTGNGSPDVWERELLFDDIASIEHAEQPTHAAMLKPNGEASSETARLDPTGGWKEEEFDAAAPMPTALIEALISELSLVRGRLPKEEYEQRLLECLRFPLADQDYYAFARLLAEHYWLEREHGKLAPWLSHLRDKFSQYPILLEEIEFFGQAMKS